MAKTDVWREAKRRKEWDTRTRQIAALIPPDSRVLEFGAWARVLEKELPEDCTYIPSDVYSRGSDTIVCDLNGDLPNFPKVDMVVFSGVLEYVQDIPRLISHLSGTCTTVIASYAFCSKSWEYKQVDEFVRVFADCGFRLTHNSTYDSNPGKRIMRFER